MASGYLLSQNLLKNPRFPVHILLPSPNLQDSAQLCGSGAGWHLQTQLADASDQSSLSILEACHRVRDQSESGEAVISMIKGENIMTYHG